MLRWPAVILFICSASAFAADEPAAPELFRANPQRSGVLAADAPAKAPAPDWTFKTRGDVVPSPVSDGARVYFGSEDRNVYALKIADGSVAWTFAAADGKEQWRFATKSRVYSSPAVAGGRVYIGSEDKHVYALDAKSGVEQWRFKTGGAVCSSPVLAGKHVLAGSYDEKLYALDAACGQEAWSFKTEGAVVSCPALAGGLLIVGSRDGSVYALK